MSRRQRVALSLSLGLVLACGRGDTPKSGAAEAAAKADSGDAATGGADKAVVDEAAAEEARKRELQHSVVFADRINYPYVLLLPDGSKDAPPTPTRDDWSVPTRGRTDRRRPKSKST